METDAQMNFAARKGAYVRLNMSPRNRLQIMIGKAKGRRLPGGRLQTAPLFIDHIRIIATDAGTKAEHKWLRKY